MEDVRKTKAPQLDAEGLEYQAPQTGFEK